MLVECCNIQRCKDPINSHQKSKPLAPTQTLLKTLSMMKPFLVLGNDSKSQDEGKTSMARLYLKASFFSLPELTTLQLRLISNTCRSELLNGLLFSSLLIPFRCSTEGSIKWHWSLYLYCVHSKILQNVSRHYSIRIFFQI